MADFESLIDMTLKEKKLESFEIKREVENSDDLDEQTQHDIALLEEEATDFDDDQDGDESFEPKTNDNKL